MLSRPRPLLNRPSLLLSRRCPLLNRPSLLLSKPCPLLNRPSLLLSRPRRFISRPRRKPCRQGNIHFRHQGRDIFLRIVIGVNPTATAGRLSELAIRGRNAHRRSDATSPS